MPPPLVRTIKDLIFYQYAKIIAASAGIPGHGFIISKMLLLTSGEIKMSSILRELKMQILSTDNCCIYCNSTDALSWDHLIPRLKDGPETAENHVIACKKCNSSKGTKGIYEWYGLKNKDNLPRLVAGKYLKLLYEIHERNGTLDKSDLNNDGKLDVLDLEIF